MKFTKKIIITVGGAILAIVAALTIITKHPIILILMGAGVGLYLLGKKLK